MVSWRVTRAGAAAGCSCPGVGFTLARGETRWVLFTVGRLFPAPRLRGRARVCAPRFGLARRALWRVVRAPGSRREAPLGKAGRRWRRPRGETRRCGGHGESGGAGVQGAVPGASAVLRWPRRALGWSLSLREAREAGRAGSWKSHRLGRPVLPAAGPPPLRPRPVVDAMALAGRRAGA